MYEYKALAIAVVDGDTIDIDIDLGLDVHHRTRVRLLGVNTPEMHSPVPEQRAAARAAREFVIEQVMGKALTVRTEKDRREKYGRYLAGVWVDGDPVSVNDKLIEGGYAVAYFGGQRVP